MTNFTTCITTFENPTRLEYLTNLIKKVRSYTEEDIILLVNSRYTERMSNAYRTQILTLCATYKDVYPIFFPEQRGLAKMWNTGAIHSRDEWILMLNDDIVLSSDDMFDKVKSISNNSKEVYKINGSFSHFLFSKSTLDQVGYFDERLLGFGEEDGDFVWRYIDTCGKYPQDLWCSGIENVVSNERDENIKSGIGKYSLFNRNFVFSGDTPKYVPDVEKGYTGTMFPVPHVKSLPDEEQYPYEKFFKKNKMFL